MSFLEVVWFIFISFAFIAYLMVLFSIIGDIFRDQGTSGWVKALWFVCLIAIPLITAIVYLIAKNDGMRQRELAAARERRDAQEAYIRDVAGAGPTPADQIAQAKQLLDSGAVSQAEFDQLKAKALG